MTGKSINARGVASVAGTNQQKPDYKKIIGQYPSSFKGFMNGQTQRVKLLPTLKQYSEILPKASFDRMLDLAKKVDDRGFSIERQNSDLILKNSKAVFKASFSGEIGNLQTTINGQTYDFSDEQVLTRYLDALEKNITSSNQASNTKSAGFGFLKQCQFLQLPFMAFESEAQAMGWFILGGFALVAVAIAVAASRVSKNLKKTEHTINHQVGVSDRTNKAIEDLGDAVNNLDPEILSNNTVNVTPPTIESPTQGLGLGVE